MQKGHHKKHLNSILVAVQKVTKLDRDPSSGTALQEISFWLNLERALVRIQEKRESPDVALTLEVLKHGKRFHATVSFDTDTGLKQAIATVNDYNPLMKDFPINDPFFAKLDICIIHRLENSLAHHKSTLENWGLIEKSLE